MNRTIVATHHCYWLQETVPRSMPVYPCRRLGTLIQYLMTCSLVNQVFLIYAGHKACVKLLLDEGADIEQRNVVRLFFVMLSINPASLS